MSSEVEERSALTSAAPVAPPTREPDEKVDRELKQLMTGEEKADIGSGDEQPAPLFLPDVTKDLRSRWNAVQSSFVDDPRQAVKQGDELVAEVMKSLTETFSNERAKLEGRLDRTDKASTETLRVALRRYRSLFERLLAL